MQESELMISGKLYRSSDNQELRNAHINALKKLIKLDSIAPENENERQNLFKELLGSVNGCFYIERGFRCDYGCNIHIGEHFYANYNCIILDVCPVTIGDHVFFGPEVKIFTAAHPIDPVIRGQDYEYGSPISIGSNVWIGGGCIINPGISIGSNCVIGSGSVVTHNIPDNVVAAGNPCRILRPVDKEDTEKAQKQLTEYFLLKN